MSKSQEVVGGLDIPAERDGDPSGESGTIGGSLVRLNKFLADCGVASRRASDQLIQQGRVEIDGRTADQLGVKVDPERQRVTVDGRELKPDALRKRYYLLHKPAGVLCTNDSREARPRAIDLIEDNDKGRIYTVGRLDEESTGLILLTNDGEFANQVMHPSHGVPKTYEVRLRGEISDPELNKIRDGVWLAEGRTGGARVIVKRRTATHSDLSVTLREGRNREIRRVFARFGFKVSRLHRARIGDLDGRGLPAGAWRPLTRREVEGLLALAHSPRPLRAERGRARATADVRAPETTSAERGVGSDRESHAGSRVESARDARDPENARNAKGKRRDKPRVEHDSRAGRSGEIVVEGGPGRAERGGGRSREAGRQEQGQQGRPRPGRRERERLRAERRAAADAARASGQSKQGRSG